MGVDVRRGGHLGVSQPFGNAHTVHPIEVQHRGHCHHSQAQVSICLPATKEALERVKRALGIDCFAEASVTKVSFSVPYMDEHIPTTGVCVEDANELAWAIEGMQCEDGELLKCLLVLFVEQPGTMQ